MVQKKRRTRFNVYVSNLSGLDGQESMTWFARSTKTELQTSRRTLIHSLYL